MIYGATSLIRKRLPLGPYSSICLGSYGGPKGGGSFLWAKHPCYCNPVEERIHVHTEFAKFAFEKSIIDHEGWWVRPE